MPKPTPHYDPALVLELYQSVRGIVDRIRCMSPLPFGEHATDNDINRDIWRRHRDLVAQAAALTGELYELVGETARLAIKRRAG